MDKKYYYKVEIEIDEEKVIADHKYSLEKMYNAIIKLFARFGVPDFTKNENTLIFYDNISDDPYRTSFPCVDLAKKEWAKPYLKKLYCYDNTEDEEYCDDIIKEVANFKVIV